MEEQETEVWVMAPVEETAEEVEIAEVVEIDETGVNFFLEWTTSSPPRDEQELPKERQGIVLPHADVWFTEVSRLP